MIVRSEKNLGYLFIVLCVSVNFFALYHSYGFAKSLYFGPLPRYIWVFWQDPPGGKTPGYIELSIRSSIHNNQQKFNVHVLNESNIHCCFAGFTSRFSE